MKKIGFYSLVCLLLIGCGGGSSTTSSSVSSTTGETTAADSQTASTIASDFKIDITKVPGYDSGDSVEDQYLSVINYLRSLKVKCNDSRAEEGPVSSIVWDSLLADAANEHSNDMNTSGVYSHDGSGTISDITGQTFTPVRASNPFERIKYNNYNYSTAGENIAFTASYPELSTSAWITTMEAWMKSDEGHCSNIMNPNFHEFGMSEIRGRKDITYNDGITRNSPVAYWTQSFGAR